MKCPRCGKTVSKFEAVTEVVDLKAKRGTATITRKVPGKTARSAKPCGCALTIDEFTKVQREYR
jgi:hypothetical protein